ncbi:unnamed protein product [Hymenolepis diminuta]|uniref:Secreted protein n=1 Tax=Hymenolepis diminuta TaxID=6216 RepID=A0A0R3SWB2_HYMDI|nr:unnamed protein product [Hymenolepis diminuta]
MKQCIMVFLLLHTGYIWLQVNKVYVGVDYVNFSTSLVVGHVENLNQKTYPILRPVLRYNLFQLVYLLISQKQRLKEIINAFQLKLCHFSGIFEVVFPDSSASVTPVLPKIRRFRPLDRQWLAQLQNRAI